MNESKQYLFATAVTLLLVLGSAGSAFAANCDCSQPLSTGSGPTATDCLKLLNVAVGIGNCAPCDPCSCRPNGGSITTATDALLCLNASVGVAVELACRCGGLTTTTSTTTTTLIPKDLNGSFRLTVSEIDENCGETLSGPESVTIVLSQDGQGNVTLVSPPASAFGLGNLQMDVVGCQLIVTFFEDEHGDGRTCFEGALDIDTDSNAFLGDLEWKFVGSIGTNCSSATICSGTDSWSAVRLP